MISEGQTYIVDGIKLCVLETIDYANKKYAFMYLEDKNVKFKFYEILDTGVGYDLKEVEDNVILEYLASNSKSIKEAISRANDFSD